MNELFNSSYQTNKKADQIKLEGEVSKSLTKLESSDKNDLIDFYEKIITFLNVRKLLYLISFFWLNLIEN